MPGGCVHRPVRQHPEQVRRLRRSHPGQQCRRAAAGWCGRPPARSPAAPRAAAGTRQRSPRPGRPRRGLRRPPSIARGTSARPVRQAAPRARSAAGPFRSAAPSRARLVASTTRSGSARWASPMALAGPTSWSASCNRSNVSRTAAPVVARSIAALICSGSTVPACSGTSNAGHRGQLSGLDRGGDRCRQVGGVQVGQLQKQQAVVQPSGGLQSNPGLADPALPGDRHRWRAVCHQIDDFRHLGLPAEQRRADDRNPAPGFIT